MRSYLFFCILTCTVTFTAQAQSRAEFNQSASKSKPAPAALKPTVKLANKVVRRDLPGTPARQVAAQARTFAYINVQYVLDKIPEKKQAVSDLNAYNTLLNDQLDSKLQEYRTKLEAYQKGVATMPDLVKADKEKELTEMQQSVEEFYRSMHNSLQQREQQLIKPILDKIQESGDQAASQLGIDYIFNSKGDPPSILHAPPGADISNLVLHLLGLPSSGRYHPAAASIRLVDVARLQRQQHLPTTPPEQAKPGLNKLQKAIDQVAVARHYQLVFNVTSSIFYYAPTYDVTSQVAGHLNGTSVAVAVPPSQKIACASQEYLASKMSNASPQVVRNLVVRFARQRGYSIIFNSSGASSSLLHAPNTDDVSDAILRFANR